MLNLETNNLLLKFNGVDESLRYPTIREFASYEKRVLSLEGDFEAIVEEGLNFLISLGLSKSTCDKLELSHVETITEKLRSPKKK